jgi:hypothetical protein
LSYFISLLFVKKCQKKRLLFENALLLLLFFYIVVWCLLVCQVWCFALFISSSSCIRQQSADRFKT